MKSIEEAAKEYAESKSSAKVFQDAHIEDFKAGIEFAERWIPVEEELPEIKEKMYQVIGKDKNGIVYPKWIKYESDIARIKYYMTHWRPINHK